LKVIDCNRVVARFECDQISPGNGHVPYVMVDQQLAVDRHARAVIKKSAVERD